MRFFRPNPDDWLGFVNRRLIPFALIGLVFAYSLPFLIELRPVREVIRMRSYMTIRHSVRTGQMTEEDVKDSLGDEYADYRKFVDSLSD